MMWTVKRSARRLSDTLAFGSRRMAAKRASAVTASPSGGAPASARLLPVGTVT